MSGGHAVVRLATDAASGSAGFGGALRVDPAALAADGGALTGTADRVARVAAAARSRAVTAYDALPSSELRLAYGYCWGRWSQLLIDTEHALAGLPALTRQAAAMYASLDRPR